MTKIETILIEVDSCGVCSNSDHEPTHKDRFRFKCHKTRRVIPNIWGEIPDFCPLPDKEGK